MYNSKLYTILQHFDKYEQNRCRKYIQSPYFNRSEELITLYEIFIKDINKPRPRSLERENIWKKLQPGKKYDDVRFRKYCSDLLKLVEGYLIQEEFESQPIQKATTLMQAVGRKKMTNLYSTALRTARRLSQTHSDRSAKYYYKQYNIENNYYTLTEFETKRGDRTNVEKIANNLDIFYFAEKLRIYCAVLNQQHFVSQTYELIFIDEIISHIKKFKDENIPPLALYYQIYLTTIENDNLDHYYKLKEKLEEHALKFPKEEALSLYYSGINYCIRQINKGNQKFLNESFDLYKSLIDREIIFLNNEMSPWDFKNVIVFALRLGKFIWVENFINSHKDKLKEEYRDNAVTYNLAQVYFYQKKYDQVIEQLRNVEYEDAAYNLGSKAMLLATYYETDEIEPLYSLFESFRAYLNRHKDIPLNRRQNYSNLIKFTKKLTRTMPGDKKALDKIKIEIKDTKNIASVKWLKEKIAELEG